MEKIFVMNKKHDRKELLAQYKQTINDVGVYRIINNITGEYLLSSDSNIKSIYNKFEFAKSTNTPSFVSRKIASVLSEYGLNNFSVEVLELLDNKPEMTQSEIDEDLKLLEEIWREKLGTEKEY